MNKKLLLGLLVTLILVVVLGLYIYQQNTAKTPASNSQTNSQSQGSQVSQEITSPTVYKGTLPCADCSGIDTTLTLNPDGTFEMSEIYQGKNDNDPFVSKGTWVMSTGTPQNPSAQVIVLTNEGAESYNYLVDGNKLTQLDSEKNPIDAPFNLSLTKVEN